MKQKNIQNYYILDKNNIIIEVSENWDEFAVNNDGMSILSEKIIGRPLMDFITGVSTKIWVDGILRSAKTNKKIVERDYRCDSPGIKRYMKMNIETLDNGKLKLNHFLLKMEKIKQPVYYRSVFSSLETLLQRCSVCGNLLFQDKWYDVDKFTDLNPQNTNEYKVIYTVCDTCNLLLHKK